MKELLKLATAISTFTNGVLFLLIFLIMFGVTIRWVDAGSVVLVHKMLTSTGNAVIGNPHSWRLYVRDTRSFAAGWTCDDDYGHSLSDCEEHISKVRDPEIKACLVEAFDDMTGSNPIGAIVGQPIFDDASSFFILFLVSINSTLFSIAVVYMLRPKATDNLTVALLINGIILTIFVGMLASLPFERKHLSYATTDEISDYQYCGYNARYN